LTSRIEFDSAALLEIDAAAEWLEARQRGLGRAFVVAVGAAVDSAAQWPNAGQQVTEGSSGSAVRRVRVGRFPYYVAYITSDDKLTVIAVAHQRRRPRYWIDRVD